MSTLDLLMLDYFSFINSFLLVFMRPSSPLWKYMCLSKKVNCTITSHMLVLSLETCQSSLRIEIIFNSFFFYLRILCTPWIPNISCLMMIDKNKFNCSASPLWKMLASTRILHSLTVCFPPAFVSCVEAKI